MHNLPYKYLYVLHAAPYLAAVDRIRIRVAASRA